MERKNTDILFSDYVKKDMESWLQTCHSVNVYAKEVVGVSRTVIFDILKGKYNSPSPLTAVRMCDWFNIEPEDLCKMITNADEDFIEKFINKYNDGRYSKNCEKAIRFFFGEHVNDYLIDNNDGYMISPNTYKKHSLASLDINCTDEKSQYDRTCCNATCQYKLYDVNEYGKYEGTGSPFSQKLITCSIVDEFELSLYYLPSVRIRKKQETMHQDEGFRIFTNKFLYLLTATNPPKNNIFITTSEKLFLDINEYLNNPLITGFNINTNNKIGVAIAYCSYRRNEEFTTIIANDCINEGMFD